MPSASWTNSATKPPIDGRLPASLPRFVYTACQFQNNCGTPLNVKIHTSLDAISASAWNSLIEDNYPFARYEFLSALEQHDGVGQRMGWYPRYFCVFDGEQLVGASMCYLKTNSHGEFVFDWAWADAYHRSGLHYYPKLVCAAPFTPATGPRLMARAASNQQQIRQLLLQTILQFCEEEQLSSFHCLFPEQTVAQIMTEQGLLLRMDFQYHWQNYQYEHFDQFLGEFKSRKRKKARRERELVAEAGIHFEVLSGADLSPEQWQRAHQFYLRTFVSKGNTPALTLDFFQNIARSMGEQIVVIFALKDSHYIACAINFRSSNTLYGRYWGCSENYNSLHFETCFYQGIAYCIANHIQRFEPGAQGEHKITRGFLPVPTWSTHWIANPHFRTPIADYLQRERLALKQYEQELWAMSPFREGLHQP